MNALDGRHSFIA